MTDDRYTVIAQGIEHPAPHMQGTYGDLIRWIKTGIYSLRVGGTIMSFPQDVGARIEYAGQLGR